MAEPQTPQTPETSETPHYLFEDPPVRADDYPPSIWVPLERLVRARRRLQVMAEKLPPAAWDADSACDGWDRRDVLAHLVAHDPLYHRALQAALDGAPLRELQPDPLLPKLGTDAWNAREVQARRGAHLLTLSTALQDSLQETLRLLSQFDEAALLLPMGMAPNAFHLLELHADHDNTHADDIINGPTMMRTL